MSGKASSNNGGGLDVSVSEVGPLAGRVGLKNMGNTCFMNAGIQCIAHIEPMAQYFLRGAFERDTSVQLPPAKSCSSSSKGQRGDLTHSFTALLRQLWECDQKTAKSPKKSGPKSKTILPKDFYNTFKQLRPFLFEDEEQQDVQEFIGFCIEGLNEDLNRVSQSPSNPTDAQMLEDERLGNEEGDDFAAALSWHRHLEREKSFLIDLLQGQQRSSVTCQRCGHMSRKFEPFMHLSIPVEKSMNCLTDGICKYLEEEELSGDEQWYCEKCKAKVDAKKKIDLWFLPPVLILHLKRFDASLTKIDKRLHMNVNGFDLSKCCSKPQRDGAVYDVSCVANHQGAYGSGHYTAVCRVGPPSSGTWHMYDDEEVTELKDSRSVATKQAYVVFLVRQGRNDLVATGLKQRSGVLAEPKLQPLLRQRMLPRCQSITSPDDWPHALGPAVKAREAAVQVALQPRASASAAVDTDKVVGSSVGLQIDPAVGSAAGSAKIHPAVGSAAVSAAGSEIDPAVASAAGSADVEMHPAAGSAEAEMHPAAGSAEAEMHPAVGSAAAETHPAVASTAGGAEASFHIGQKVQRHDGGGDWQEGFVTSLEPMLVTASAKDPQGKGHEWYEVRHIPEISKPKKKRLLRHDQTRPVVSDAPVSSANASAQGEEPEPAAKDNASAGSKFSIAASFRNVFTPARRSRSESEDANQSLPKRQKSILDFCRSSVSEDVKPASPKQQKSLLDFFTRQ